jgi:predicted nucleic acid-binding protein
MKLALDSGVIMRALSVGEGRPAASHPADDRPAQVATLLKSGEHTFIVPAIALAEAIAALEPRHRRAAIALFKNSMEVVAFDTKAAIAVGDLWKSVWSPREGRDRVALKADIDIIACAARWEAEGFCTFDDDARVSAEESGQFRKVGTPLQFSPQQQALVHPRVRAPKKRG